MPWPDPVGSQRTQAHRNRAQGTYFAVPFPSPIGSGQGHHNRSQVTVEWSPMPQPGIGDGDQPADLWRRGCNLVRRLVASVAQFDAAVRKLLSRT